LGHLIDKIMEQGAKDISIYPGITKKGRPTNLICIICNDEKVNEITDILVLETGTLGIRISDSNRIIVPRTNHSFSLTFEGKSFEIKYKKSTYKEKTHFKIEFEDLKNISKTLDKPIRDVELFLRKEIEEREDP
jgi:pyridinium-3,5-bisthiocarboxylic acid mononucleotide nickel chelatase